MKLTSAVLSFAGTVRVQLLEQHKAALIAATNDATLLLALNDTAVGTEIIKVWIMMFVLSPVMHVQLEKNLSPRQAFLKMHAFLGSNHALIQFSPLVDFLYIASMANNCGYPNNLYTTPGPVFFSDKKLTGFMKDQVLYRNLLFHNPCTITAGNHDNHV